MTEDNLPDPDHKILDPSECLALAVGSRQLKRGEVPGLNTVTVVFDALTRLVPRLAAAERLCVMFGWTGADMITDRGKAAHELWAEWLDISGVSNAPGDHPDLSDERIAHLAARRDAKRTLALAKIASREDIPPAARTLAARALAIYNTWESPAQQPRTEED